MKNLILISLILFSLTAICQTQKQVDSLYRKWEAEKVPAIAQELSKVTPVWIRCASTKSGHVTIIRGYLKGDGALLDGKHNPLPKWVLVFPGDVMERKEKK